MKQMWLVGILAVVVIIVFGTLIYAFNHKGPSASTIATNSPGYTHAPGSLCSNPTAFGTNLIPVAHAAPVSYVSPTAATTSTPTPYPTFSPTNKPTATPTPTQSPTTKPTPTTTPTVKPTPVYRWYAINVSISGKVTRKNGQPLDNHTIDAVGKPGSVDLGDATTDKNGNYSISQNSMVCLQDPADSTRTMTVTIDAIPPSITRTVTLTLSGYVYSGTITGANITAP